MLKEAVIFGSTGTVIVDTGIKVGATHIGKVQKFVQGRLEAIENELKDEKQRALEDVKMEAATIKAEAG